MGYPDFFDEIGIGESQDKLLVDIHKDLEGCSSPLELLSNYMREARAKLSDDPPAYRKLAKLFERGRVPEKVEGHLYGVTLGLRTRMLRWVLFKLNILNFFWGKLLAKNPPWVGKGFNKGISHVRKDVLARVDGMEDSAQVGINYFRKARGAVLNWISIMFLNVLFRLKKASGVETGVYGYDKTGGIFVFRPAKSVDPDADDKKVIQINYRWPFLNNPFPLKYLIDEIVEVADGLYLGQLLFATKKLFSTYDALLPSKEYQYAHFGYFLLMDNRWNEERRRLFPYTEGMWLTKAHSIDWKSSKFTEFTFAEPVEGACDDDKLQELQKDLVGKETALDLLRFYSKKLRNDCDVNSPHFSKLNEMFNRGVAPRVLKGYFHGAVVAFRNQGFIRTFNINTLNLLWPLARHFSPWTGKTFEDMQIEKLKEITDGFETGEIPTVWGTNTYSGSTVKQKLVVGAMRIADIKTQEASAKEKRTRGYDLKSFFFIAHQGKSVNEENGGKTVFQFNYRWPKLRTFPPDNYCIDEIVQVADGLYLGQLLYATKLLDKYDPKKDPYSYNYHNFGYFLLMDDDWHARRLMIDFDIIPSDER